MSTPRYATREDVKRALDTAETARTNGQIDRALEAATESVHGLCQRRFYPEIATRYFDWPDLQMGRAYRLWLDGNDLISLTSMISGGIPITAYLLEPQRYGPPYTRVEIDLHSNAGFGGGNTPQRNIEMTGVWGYRNDEATAGALAGAVDGSVATITVTDGAAIGVGDLIRVDSERLLVVGRQQTSTGQTLQSALTASSASTAVTVTDGTAYSVDEVILLDAESMLIVDIAGNTLIVKRAWDGSVLATHTGSTIYASRTLTVERGALGTTAAAHDSAASIYRFLYPPLIRRLGIAEAMSQLGLEKGGYARSVSRGGENTKLAFDPITDVREQALTAHGRKARTRVV